LKIFTSNLFDQRDNPVAYCIAAKTPAFFVGRTFKKLVPNWDLVCAYKRGEIDEQVFELLYRTENLSDLDARVLAEELGDEAILCCWERAPNFCHRNIVATWFIENGIECEEI